MHNHVLGASGAAGFPGRDGNPGRDGGPGATGPAGHKGEAGVAGRDGSDGEALYLCSFPPLPPVSLSIHSLLCLQSITEECMDLWSSKLVNMLPVTNE